MWAEILTLAGLIGLGVASMFMLPTESKDVVMAVVSGLLGYVARGVTDKVTETKTEVQVPEVKKEDTNATH